jgi:hypothetical protein
VPVKVLHDLEHFGKGPSSLHNAMYAWKDGKLAPENLKNIVSPQEMMNLLIDFYDKNGYADLAKITRAWCVKNNVPFTL